jgi:hypothetical protein
MYCSDDEEAEKKEKEMEQINKLLSEVVDIITGKH